MDTLNQEQKTSNRFSQFIKLGVLLEVDKALINNFQFRENKKPLHVEITNTIIDFNHDINYDNLFKYLAPSHICIQVQGYDLHCVINTICKKYTQHWFYIYVKDACNLNTDDFAFDIPNILEIHIFLPNREEYILKSVFETAVFIHPNQYPLLETYKISRSNFNCNTQFYFESLTKNPYFFQKMFVDNNGFIKNAPECKEVVGNINSLASYKGWVGMLNNPNLQKYWYINKSICDVCKDCEFRNMCTDNRVPIKRDLTQWYFKTECNYNPYIGKWKGDPGYYTLQECNIFLNDKRGL